MYVRVITSTCLDSPFIRAVNQELRERLVDPLPVGAMLTAIFDSCHSGTLLDLDHYLCNTVYFPWVNKGTRDAGAQPRAGVRKHCFEACLERY